MASVFKLTAKRVAKTERRARVEAGEESEGSDLESSGDELSDEDDLSSDGDSDDSDEDEDDEDSEDDEDAEAVLGLKRKRGDSDSDEDDSDEDDDEDDEDDEDEEEFTLTVEEAATSPLIPAGDFLGCVLCPEKVLKNESIAAEHLSSAAHARALKRWNKRLADAAASGEELPSDPRVIVAGIMEALLENTRGLREGPDPDRKKKADAKLAKKVQALAEARAKAKAGSKPSGEAENEAGDVEGSAAESKVEDVADGKKVEGKSNAENSTNKAGTPTAGLNRRQRRALARGEAPVKGKLSAAAARKAKQADRSKEKKAERKESAARAEEKAEVKAEEKAAAKAGKANGDGKGQGKDKGKPKKGRTSLPASSEQRPAKRARKSMP